MSVKLWHECLQVITLEWGLCILIYTGTLTCKVWPFLSASCHCCQEKREQEDKQAWALSHYAQSKVFTRSDVHEVHTYLTIRNIDHAVKSHTLSLVCQSKFCMIVSSDLKVALLQHTSSRHSQLETGARRSTQGCWGLKHFERYHGCTWQNLMISKSDLPLGEKSEPPLPVTNKNLLASLWLLAWKTFYRESCT